MSCVFCGLAADESKQLVMVHNAFVVQAIDPEGKPKAGAYLVIPKRHASHEPLDWSLTRDSIVYALLRRGVTVDNSVVNLTPEGGRTVEHYHEWLLDRSQIDGGGLGFYGTLVELQKARSEISDLRRQLAIARSAADALDRGWHNAVALKEGYH